MGGRIDSRLLQLTDAGFYCEVGDFYIDPWQPVQRAVVTHAHADHFAHGCGAYLVAETGRRVFRERLGVDALIEKLPFGQTRNLSGVTVSLHPAGHILGSAQVRVEYRGEVWVVSGDYKTEPDPTCTPFELVPCDVFITEATFGLPIYKWPPQSVVFDQINAWWRENKVQGKASILYGYALGKAQRLLAGVDPSIGPIFTHGAVERLTQVYRESRIALPETTYVSDDIPKSAFAGALIIAPPSTRGTHWLRRFGNQSDGYVSGWMTMRGTRRRWAIDRGFILSDHVDWPALLDTIQATGAEHIGVTHGRVDVVVRWLRQNGYSAQGFRTRYTDDVEEQAS